MTNLLTRQQAATRLQISPTTLAKWAVTGYGPAFVKVGRSVRYRSEDIEAFILGRLQGSTSNMGATPIPS